MEKNAFVAKLTGKALQSMPSEKFNKIFTYTREIAETTRETLEDDKLDEMVLEIALGVVLSHKDFDWDWDGNNYKWAAVNAYNNLYYAVILGKVVY